MDYSTRFRLAQIQEAHVDYQQKYQDSLQKRQSDLKESYSNQMLENQERKRQQRQKEIEEEQRVVMLAQQSLESDQIQRSQMRQALQRDRQEEIAIKNQLLQERRAEQYIQHQQDLNLIQKSVKREAERSQAYRDLFLNSNDKIKINIAKFEKPQSTINKLQETDLLKIDIVQNEEISQKNLMTELETLQKSGQATGKIIIETRKPSQLPQTSDYQRLTPVRISVDDAYSSFLSINQSPQQNRNIFNVSNLQHTNAIQNYQSQIRQKLSSHTNLSTQNLNTLATITKRNEQNLPAIERNSSLPIINTNFDSTSKVSHQAVDELKIEGRLRYRPQDNLTYGLQGIVPVYEPRLKGIATKTKKYVNINTIPVKRRSPIL